MMGGFRSQILCRPGSVINEDATFAGRDWFMVLDGSSGLDEQRTISGVSEAAWFVGNFGRDFAREIQQAPDTSLAKLMELAVHSTAQRYRIKTAGMQVDHIDQPSASVIAVRLADYRLDYFLLGDASLVANSRGVVHVLQDRRVAALDAAALAELRSAMRDKPFASALKAIQPTLLRNRAQKNTQGGYGVLEPSDACLAMARTGSLNLGDTGNVIAFTDGFGALVDIFKAVPDYPALLDLVSGVGVSSAEQQLLRQSHTDPDCRNFPRFKMLDDYTCIHIRW